MVTNLYYNVFRKTDDLFMGTIAVRINPNGESESAPSIPPSIHACMIAESKLLTEHTELPVGLYAVMSTKEMHLQYGLN